MPDASTGPLGLTNKDWLGLGLGGASMLPMLFGGGGNDSDISSALGDLKGTTKDLQGKGKAASGQSAELLGPALDYLKKVIGGDRQQLMEATMPERRRVIDQYDAAKKATAEFSPRGGGTAGALSSLNASEASDLAMVGSGARSDAVKTSGALGTTLSGQGIGADQAASNNMNTILQTYIQQGQQSGQSAADLGMGVASLLGMIFL